MSVSQNTTLTLLILLTTQNTHIMSQCRERERERDREREGIEERDIDEFTTLKGTCCQNDDSL